MTTATFVIESIEVTQLPYASRGERHNAVGTRGGRTLINVDVKGESLAENLIYRKSRPTKIYRKVVEQVREQITAEHGINLDKFVWSQDAWCSCGCSPAFLGLTSRGYRIDITVSGIANEADEVAKNRAASLGVEIDNQ